MKTLKRTVIMRQYDYNKKLSVLNRYYTRCEFMPLLIQELERMEILDILKNPNRVLPLVDYSKNIFMNMLQHPHIKNLLHNPDYLRWYHEQDSDGHVWIWSRSNNPKSILGLASFEYDYAKSN